MSLAVYNGLIPIEWLPLLAMFAFTLLFCGMIGVVVYWILIEKPKVKK